MQHRRHSGDRIPPQLLLPLQVRQASDLLQLDNLGVHQAFPVEDVLLVLADLHHHTLKQVEDHPGCPFATIRPASLICPTRALICRAHVFASFPCKNTLSVAELVRTVRTIRCPAGVCTSAVDSCAPVSASSPFAGSTGGGVGIAIW